MSLQQGRRTLNDVFDLIKAGVKAKFQSANCSCCFPFSRCIRSS